MKHVNSWEKYNELFGIKMPWNKDEDIAKKILDGMKDDISINKHKQSVFNYRYTFKYNGSTVNVYVGLRLTPSGSYTSYELSVDGKDLRVSNHLIEKIYKKAKYISDTPKREDDNYNKDDFRRTFDIKSKKDEDIAKKILELMDSATFERDGGRGGINGDKFYEFSIASTLGKFLIRIRWSILITPSGGASMNKYGLWLDETFINASKSTMKEIYNKADRSHS